MAGMLSGRLGMSTDADDESSMTFMLLYESCLAGSPHKLSSPKTDGSPMVCSAFARSACPAACCTCWQAWHKAPPPLLSCIAHAQDLFTDMPVYAQPPGYFQQGGGPGFGGRPQGPPGGVPGFGQQGQYLGQQGQQGQYMQQGQAPQGIPHGMQAPGGFPQPGQYMVAQGPYGQPHRQPHQQHPHQQHAYQHLQQGEGQQPYMQQGFGQGSAGYGQPQQAGASGFGQNQGQSQGMPNGDQQAAAAAPTFVDPFSGLLPGLGSALPSVRPLYTVLGFAAWMTGS